MHKNIFTLILSIFIVLTTAYAQRIDDFELIQSKGSIPEDFIIKSSETYRQSNENTNPESSEDRFERKTKNQFLLKNSFDIRELLYNGKIIFNDELSAYINKVADKLLEKDPQLRAKLKFYIVQSPVVNAFTTNSGQIFINMGLLAYLRNESQLAFILAHEIMHFKKQHVLKSYVETQKIIQKKGDYKWLDNQDFLVTKNNYSKEIESEADLAGFDELFKNSDYTTKDLPFLFEVLKYADLPYKHEAIDLSLFYLENVPDNIKMNSDISIKERTDNDSISTHPTPDKRNKALQKKYEGLSADNKSEYLVSKEEFDHCRNSARMHLPFMYLQRNDFERALYFASLIIPENKDSKYLKDIIAKSLYGYTLFRSYKVSEEYDLDGGLKKFNEWINSIGNIELHFTTLNYLTKLKNTYPNDPKYEILISSLIENLVKKEEYDYNRLYNDYLLVPNQPEEKRINSSSNGSLETAPRVYFFHLLDTIIVKGQMRDVMEMASKSVKSKKERTEANRKNAKYQKIQSKYGTTLEIDSLVIVNPDYEKIDQRKKKAQRYVASEAAQVSLNDKIIENARLSNLNVYILDDHTLTSKDVDQYNDLATLTNWFGEKVYQLSNDVEMENLNPELVKKLTTKYGTKYFAWTGYRAVREKKKNKGALIGASIIYFPILPITTIYLLHPDYSTYHYFVLFNIETGKPVYVKSQRINKRDRPDVLNSCIYDTFYQLKKKKK